MGILVFLGCLINGCLTRRFGGVMTPPYAPAKFQLFAFLRKADKNKKSENPPFWENFPKWRIPYFSGSMPQAAMRLVSQLPRR